MNTVLIFVWVWGAMASIAFWEAYVEGRYPWHKRKLGWKIKMGNYWLPAYHFYLFFITLPMLLTLPFIIYGWDGRLFGILASAYLSGMVLEDFLWYVVNPDVKLSEFNPKFADFYPWWKIGPIHLPAGYPVGIALSILIWFFVWR